MKNQNNYLKNMSMGRGLGALLAPTTKKKNEVIIKSTATERSGSSERVWMIPLSEITPNPDQPRKNFKQEELKELADSIREHGVLQPILVAEKADGGYNLVAGERRYRAAKMLNLATIPALVKQWSDEKKLEVALIENIQRSQLNPLEEAFAFQRLIEQFGLTQQALADKVGKSRPAIANSIRLLGLPEEIQKALADEKISMGQARALLSVTDLKQQMDVFRSMLGEKISVREVERKVKEKTGKIRKRDPNLIYIEEELRGALGTKVTVNQKGEEGLITIHYFSKEELQEIVRKIVD